MSRFLSDCGELRQAYWMIRVMRANRNRVKYYRRAKKAADRLVSMGYDRELLRLYRLTLISPHLEHRELRFADCYESVLGQPYPYRPKNF